MKLKQKTVTTEMVLTGQSAAGGGDQDGDNDCEKGSNCSRVRLQERAMKMETERKL